MQARAIKQEERWSPTTIHTTFTLRALPAHCTLSHRNITIPLRLLNLGWTFTLSLTPKRIGGMLTYDYPPKFRCKWTPAALTFRQRDSTIPWKNTSMHVQLSLATEQQDCEQTEQCMPQTEDVDSVLLADTSSAEFPLGKSYLLSSSRPTNISLSVTVQNCPFSDGLFCASSLFENCRGSDTEAQIQLVRQSGDRVLNRSLTTGKLFDTKFVSSSTRSGKPLATYASLSVLEKHIHLPSAKIGEEWSNAVATLDDDSIHSKEILSSNDDEYELDSDFYDDDDDDDDDGEEHEEEARVEPGTSSLPRERDKVVIVQVEPRESSPASVGSTTSWTSYTMDQTSDQLDDSVEFEPEEVGRDQTGAPGATEDHERTLLVKFAAHRTWHAFLWYCYTGHVEFSTLKSQSVPGVQRLSLADRQDGPPCCSPKSMYRLADLVGNDDLKAMALEAIKERMVEANILDETFSVFTSKYPEVRRVQLDVLMNHIGSSEIKDAFIRKMMKFGDLRHAAPVLLAFCDTLAASRA